MFATERRRVRARDTAGRPHPRGGYALIVALGAMMVIGASLAGVFFAALQAYRTGAAMLVATRALGASELGLYAALDTARWDPRWRTIRAGLVGTFVLAPEPGATDSVRIIKLSAEQFLILSDARVGAERARSARRRTGVLVVLDTRTDSTLAEPVVRSVPVIARGRSWIELP